jgi:hypothetical protein
MAASNWSRTGLVLCGWVVGACTADPPAGAPQYTPAVPQTPPRQTTIPAHQSLRAVVDAVLADAARRTGRPIEEIEVVSAQSVTWSDGSLGCPQPGMMYTQALVPGYRVVIEVGEERYDYHASLRGGFSLCPAGQAIDPVSREDAI